MKLLIINKLLNWLIQKKENYIKRIDFFIGKLIFNSDLTLEDYEKLKLSGLFEKIEEEPNNPHHYYLRGNMRMSKQVNNPFGAIEDFTKTIKLISVSREQYPEIDLCFCHYSICKKANIYGNSLMEIREFTQAAQYYKLSVSSGQELLQNENQNAMYKNECEVYIEKSSNQLILIQNLNR